MSERPIDKWRRKLEFLQAEEAISSDPAQRFTIQEQIREAEQKIAELEIEASKAHESQIPEAPFETGTSDPGAHATDAGESSFDVFLSHNSKDKPAVEELGETLKIRGLRVWLDKWELIPGRSWQNPTTLIDRLSTFSQTRNDGK